MKTIQLTFCTNFVLIPTTPFDFDSTFFKPDHFTTDDHEYAPGVRWQTMNWQGELLGIKYSNVGERLHPKIQVEVFSNKHLQAAILEPVKTEVSYRYNLALDIQSFYTKYQANLKLKGPIERLYGMRPGQPSSLYEYVIIGIILQNASVRRSIQMFRNLLTRYGTEVEFDGKKLLCLWSAGRFKEIPEQELRDLKIGYRARSIKRVDEQFASGSHNEFQMRKFSVLEQKKQLLALYGVGPATVWYLLFDIFHRWEVFEHISPWEQKLYSQLFFNRGLDKLATVKQLLTFINKFGQYKHLAVHYLWEDLWWRRQKGEKIEWLEREIRI